jgi:hypothetical protein
MWPAQEFLRTVTGQHSSMATALALFEVSRTITEADVHGSNLSPGATNFHKVLVICCQLLGICGPLHFAELWDGTHAVQI